MSILSQQIHMFKMFYVKIVFTFHKQYQTLWSNSDHKFGSILDLLEKNRYRRKDTFTTLTTTGHVNERGRVPRGAAAASAGPA